MLNTAIGNGHGISLHKYAYAYSYLRNALHTPHTHTFNYYFIHSSAGHANLDSLFLDLICASSSHKHPFIWIWAQLATQCVTEMLTTIVYNVLLDAYFTFLTIVMCTVMSTQCKHHSDSKWFGYTNKYIGYIVILAQHYYVWKFVRYGYYYYVYEVLFLL